MIDLITIVAYILLSLIIGFVLGANLFALFIRDGNGKHRVGNHIYYAEPVKKEYESIVVKDNSDVSDISPKPPGNPQSDVDDKSDKDE